MVIQSKKKFKISETKEPKPTKIGLHAFHIDLYLHECFEPILFFDPHGLYSPWSEGKFWPFSKANKRGKISKTGVTTPTKIGLHTFHIDLYLHEFFELILFLTPMDSPWSKGKIWPFWRQAKRSHNSETGDTTPTKIGLHAFQVNLYLHEFLESILFFDPLGL